MMYSSLLVFRPTLSIRFMLQGGSSQSVPVFIILSREGIAKPAFTEPSCSYISVSLNESHAIKRVLAIPCQSNHQAS